MSKQSDIVGINMKTGGILFAKPNDIFNIFHAMTKRKNTLATPTSAIIKIDYIPSMCPNRLRQVQVSFIPGVAMQQQ